MLFINEFEKLKADRKTTAPLHAEAEFKTIYDQVGYGAARSLSDLLCRLTE